MNKFKSLSDSSTSESEDDYGKRNSQVPYDSWRGIKRTHSTDEAEEECNVELFYKMASQNTKFKSPSKFSEQRLSSDNTEDEHLETVGSTMKKLKGDFKNPAQYIERGFSTDDTEDEHLETIEFPAKGFKDFKNPTQCIKRELSSDQTDSDSEDKTVSMKVTNMPSLDTLNGSYGVGMKLMKKMGYKPGTGLGKSEQGRVSIVEASKQRGRRGLGLTIAGLEPSDTIWDSSKEEISLKEEVLWIPDTHLAILSISQLREWMTVGEKTENIDDETEFCDPEILRKIILFKNVFNVLEPDEMRKARTRSNPFETIRGGIFLNRAAMKMANMDYAFEFMFTNPKTLTGEPAITGNELLYFADICAGPGGFSEYVLWKRKWGSKGFGFTLKDKNDFKLEDFFSGPPETFEPHYGEKGDGNIYDRANLMDFKKFVRSNTDDKGVHFVMADGGFSVEGKENEQEILSKRLYLCQFQCALAILRTGGHFVCKLFDLFTPFSVGLVYLMYMVFEKVCIFKPNTSRPANSERYIICKWLKENTRDVADYLYEVNDYLDRYSNSEKDISEVVPLRILKGNEEFYNYIVNSNDKLGARQIVHLDKIRVFAKNTTLHEERQSSLRKDCLELWQVPDQARAAPKRCEPDSKYKEIMQGEKLAYISGLPLPLTTASLKKLNQIFDFHCVVCGETKPEQPPSLFIGLGKSNIYRYDLKDSKWKKIEDNLELPAGTLFYGELLTELKGESRAQRRITALHIIDAIFLGGKDVRNLHFDDRMLQAEKLAKAVSKPTKNYAPLRVKQAWSLEQVEDIFDRLSMKFVKNSPVPRLCFDLGDGRHIIPAGLLIFKTTKDPWMRAFSKTHQRIYLFNIKKNISKFEKITEASSDFMSCFSDRILWSWGRDVKLIKEQNIEPNSSIINGQNVIDFVQYHLKKMTGRTF